MTETNESEDVTMNEVATGDMTMKVDDVTELNEDDKPMYSEKKVESKDMTINNVATATGDMRI